MITMCSVHRLSTPTTVSRITKQMAGEGFDAWLIEMVGGLYTDDTSSEGCGSSCPNYTFADLKDHYWPVSIAGIQKYSGKSKVDYVGFSLGCSAALESLETHQTGKNNSGYYFDYNTGQYKFVNLSPYPVDTFVGIGCPGNFTELPSMMGIFNITKEDVFESAKRSGVDHLTGGKFRRLTYPFRSKVEEKDPDLYLAPDWGVLYLTSFIPFGDTKMSINVYDEFYKWVNNPSQPNLGSGAQLNNTLLIQGKATGLSRLSMAILNPSPVDTNSDLIVPAKDMKMLCGNINSTNKYYASFNKRTHAGFRTNLPDDPDVNFLISDFLKYKTVQNHPSHEFNQDCSTI